jgi:hypothetical protein
MAGITTYFSILTLNVMVSTPPSKTPLANLIKKDDPTSCCLQEPQLTNRNKHWLRVKGWKRTYQLNGPPKQTGVAKLTSDKVDFKLTLVIRDKQGHFILIKEQYIKRK